MASILRSGKFVRYFAGLTRSIVFNTVRETEGSLIQNTQCICSGLTQSYTTTAATKPDQSLERSLRRLDQDVRRTGRLSRRDIEEVLEEIRHQRSATSSQSLLVIRYCGNLVPEELPEVRTSLVQEIWKTLNSLNVPMDISHYNALLRVYLENEHQFSPTDFLSDLETKGVEPNRVTYQRLIARYCQQGDIEGATRILEFMREKGLPVNENVFNALILGHSEANDIESAAGILAVMKQAGLEPSADTYATLLCCYAKHGNIETILKTFDECEKKEIYLLDKDFLDVVYALATNGFGDKVDPVLEKIRKSAGYNQDAVNIILRLTNKGYEDIAFKILKTMPRATRQNGELTDTGNFFIRQLIKAQRPIEKIVKICNELKNENLNKRALLIATEASLGQTKNAMPLLKEMKNSGFPIRQHYFWPLICSAKANDVIEVIKEMQNEFQVNPNSETIRDYVIPNLNEKNWDTIVTMLRNVGISVATAASSAAFSAIQANKIEDAANIMQNYRAYYAPGLYRKPLIIALSKTKDFDSYVKIVRQIYDNLPRAEGLNAGIQDETEEAAVGEGIENNEETPAIKQAEVLGIMVMDAVLYFKRDQVPIITEILKGLVQQGLTISNHHAERIQDRMASVMRTEISDLLAKLSSGDLEPTELDKSNRRGSLENLPIEQLERLIETVESKNDNANGIKRSLITACLKSKDLEKTKQVIDKLESENYSIGNGIYSQFIDLYCHHGKLDEALKLYEQIRSKEPDFILDNFKVIRFVDLFIKENKMDEAIAFIEKNKKEDLLKPNSESSFNYTTTCWKLLNSMAEAGNENGLNIVFNALRDNNYIESSNVLLGSLVKVHLLKDDLQKAVDTFETICNKYKSTPWKNELACRLIQAEDATNLQRLTDLSTNIHGEVNSLYDLVFSFVECGRIRQARKILETPGLRNRSQRINSACERYHQEGMIQSLEGLVEATKDLNHIDRNDIFYNLLLSYCKDDQPEKALGLWTKMQEEDISPTDQFLSKLAEFLNSKNVVVPFVVPSTHKSNTINVSTTTSTSKQQKSVNTTASASTNQNSNISENLRNFKNSIRSGNVDAAISAKKQLQSSETPSITDLSHFVELLVKSDRLNEATKSVDEMLQQKQYPIARIFKFYLNKLANSGDTATMDRLRDDINEDMKKIVSFDNRYCHANITAGKAESYLNKLKKDMENAKTDEQIQEVAEKFPRGGALGILETHPELTEKFEEMAEFYASKNITSPMNVLWINYFNNNNEEKSNKIWEKYLKTSPRLMFQRVLQITRDTQNENLIQRLIKHLKEAKISEGALGNAYSCYLDVLTTKGRYDEALELLKNKAIPDVCLENINKTALLRLKEGLVSNGKEFPYKIPKKNQKEDTSSSSSSSSASSDDDVTPTKPETQPNKKN